MLLNIYMYLRVEGLTEFSNETLLTRVATVLSGTGIACTTEDLDFARRIGAYKEGYTRPILIRFNKESKRNAILYNRNNINRNKTSNFIWVNDDTSDETRRNRKTSRDVATLAKLIGMDNIKIHGDGIIVNDVKYKHSDFDLLPPEISIEKAKTRESEGEVYFQGEHSPLSNFYPATFTDDTGKIYYNAEQAYQCEKAKFHGKMPPADKILCTRNPYSIKKLSKDIPSNNDWVIKEQGVMKSILDRKFHQNLDLATKHINTGDRQLHEATSDHKWATGAELASKSTLNTEWTGQDLLGQLLETVRTELIAKHQQQQQTAGCSEDQPYALCPPPDDHISRMTLLPYQRGYPLLVRTPSHLHPSLPSRPLFQLRHNIPSHTTVVILRELPPQGRPALLIIKLFLHLLLVQYQKYRRLLPPLLPALLLPTTDLNLIQGNV